MNSASDPSPPVRVGIAGLGRAGWGLHFAYFRNNPHRFRVVAVTDADPSRAEEARAAGGCRIHPDVAALAADPDVELVVVATRSCDHATDAAVALGAGKHVYVEKPIALDAAAAEELVHLARRSEGMLFPGHNRRFEPAFVHFREIIASGILGDVFEIKFRRLGYQRRDDWQTLRAFGGGQLLNWGPHVVDQALQFLADGDLDLVSSLRCLVAAGDCEDHVRILITDQTGCTADIQISGAAAIPEPEFTALGTRGALTATGDSLRLRALDPEQRLPTLIANPATPDGRGYGWDAGLRWEDTTFHANPEGRSGLSAIWDHVFEAIRENKPFPVTPQQALRVMRVISDAKRGTPFAGHDPVRRKPQSR